MLKDKNKLENKEKFPAAKRAVFEQLMEEFAARLVKGERKRGLR
jgi:hypothetical protein